MHKRFVIPMEVSRLLNAQGGVIDRRQANALGVTDAVVGRLVEQGLWHPVARGIFGSVPQPTWSGLAWAGVLRGGEGSVLSGAAAAHLWHVHPEPSVIDVDVPPARCHRPDGAWVFHRRLSIGVGDPPRTRLPETVLRVCSTLSEGDAVTLLAEVAFRTRLSVEHLQREWERQRYLPQRQMLRELLADVDEGARSPLELRYLRRVERAHGLPRAVRQASTKSGFTDALYRDFGLLIELDGVTHHSGGRRFDDMWRDNQNGVEGSSTLRYGTKHVYGDACAVAWQVGEALMLRGWAGPVTACPRCQSRHPRNRRA